MPVAITESSEPGRNGKLRFPRSSASQAQRSFNNGFAARVKGKPRPRPRPPAPVERPSGAPSGLGLHTAQEVWALTWKTCKWPIGDPQDRGFRFCCDTPVEGKSYCRRHCAASVRGGKECATTDEDAGGPSARTGGQQEASGDANRSNGAMTPAKLRAALKEIGIGTARDHRSWYDLFCTLNQLNKGLACVAREQ
jgi:GcrA cell cycle regulator